MAEGSDGSLASTPVTVIEMMPVPPAAPEPPSIATSLSGGQVVKDGTLTVLGAGFKSNEFVSLSYITGTGSAGELIRSAISPGPQANATGAFEYSFVAKRDPGIYTLEATGALGSLATAAIVILAEAK